MVLPSKIHAWKDQVSQAGMKDTSIHSFKGAGSGSDISFRQFLALQVIWEETYMDSKFRSLIIPHFYNLAQQTLGHAFWTSYTKSIDNTRIIPFEPFTDFGSMTLVRYYQLLCSNLRESKEGSTLSSVVTRSQTKPFHTSAEPGSAQASGTSSRGQFSEFENMLAEVSGLSLGDVDASIPKTPPSTGKGIVLSTPASSSTIHPRNEDEQIPNTALILYLSSLVIFTSIPVNWTLHRKPFRLQTLQDKDSKQLPAVYEARVDGYLRGYKDDNAKIILEVKPFLRRLSYQKIQMQESAQFTAWISDEPDEVRRKDQRFRRLLIAQDRHEIYVMIGEYDAAYIYYVTGKVKEPGKSFLRITESGPYVITDSSDMNRLGKLLLAYIYQEFSQG